MAGVCGETRCSIRFSRPRLNSPPRLWAAVSARARLMKMFAQPAEGGLESFRQVARLANHGYEIGVAALPQIEADVEAVGPVLLGDRPLASSRQLQHLRACRLIEPAKLALVLVRNNHQMSACVR